MVLRAEYTDRGANGMPAITKDNTVVLRSPSVVVANAELSEGLQKQSVPEIPIPVTVVNRSGGSVAFKQIDLTGVSAKRDADADVFRLLSDVERPVRAAYACAPASMAARVRS